MARNGKILELDELAATLGTLRSQGKKIVHSHGVFDLLHVGHLRHFEEAKKMGDVLVVTLTRDEHVNKGPHRPAFGQDLRAEAIAALSVVDYVAINRWPLSVEAIKLLQPHIYVKGSDYKISERDITGGILQEADAIRAVGGEIRFTDGITFSSSALLNRHLSPFMPEVDRYLEAFRRQHSVDEVLEWLGRTSTLRPLVVGEAIIDEYVFCEAIGKSTKDPVLAVQQQSIEACAGGSLAVANHLAGFCHQVDLVTQLGSTERREEFVREALRPNVTPMLLTKSGAPTIHKRRIVDRYSGNKLLELYSMEDTLTAGDDDLTLQRALMDATPRSDVAIVADYGHGMMTPDAIEVLSKEARFLAVNAQSNAGNRGFNPISKYVRADYMCLAAHELALENRKRDGSLKEELMMLVGRLDCPRFTITAGKRGTLHYDQAAGFTEAPALATVVQDRVGAGDAVLAITSLLVRVHAPWDIVAFVGNVAGAELVAELGNRLPIERVALSKHITALLK